MSTLQVKNLPDELHAELIARARAERITLSEFVTRTLRKELARPSLDAWIESIDKREGKKLDIDSGELIDEVRGELDR